VIMAGRNDARYLRDGEGVSVPGRELFDHYVTVPVEGLGDFEGYPNRDSLPFISQYGIQSTRGMFRGTLRNLGWCQTLKKLGELGFFSEEVRDDLAGRSFQQVLADQIGVTGTATRSDLAAHLSTAETSTPISNLEWLGLLSDDPIPPKTHTLLDVLTQRMLQLMSFEPGERDLIVLKHEFLAQYPQRQERISSTLIDFGIPHGDSAMARTVSLPAAIAVRMILQGQISERGVRTPVISAIYDPVLAELEEMGIRCDDVTETI
jgi:saccharopine dehydrogenase (NADP+, L-glutamate forming)